MIDLQTLISKSYLSLEEDINIALAFLRIAKNKKSVISVSASKVSAIYDFLRQTKYIKRKRCVKRLAYLVCVLIPRSPMTPVCGGRRRV